MRTVEPWQDGHCTAETVADKGPLRLGATLRECREGIRVNARGLNSLETFRAFLYLAKNHAKALCDLWQWMKVVVLQALGIIDYPVPPNSLMRATSSKTIRHYYGSGLRSLMPMVTAVANEGLDFNRPLTVLDFGCGVGRILLHLNRLHPHLAFHACDVNSRAVKYMREAFPAAHVTLNRFRAPLDYPDATFDWVYSVSIFSHLNEQDQRWWLHELARVIRPGGFCCLTIMGPHAVDQWQDMTAHERGAARAALARDGLYYNGHPKPVAHQAAERISTFGSHLIGIDESYGDTFCTEAHVREQWDNQDFALRQYHPGVIDNLQDLVVLRRRKPI